jgi:hypothetical protein
VALIQGRVSWPFGESGLEDDIGSDSLRYPTPESLPGTEAIRVEKRMAAATGEFEGAEPHSCGINKDLREARAMNWLSEIWSSKKLPRGVRAAPPPQQTDWPSHAPRRLLSPCCLTLKTGGGSIFASTPGSFLGSAQDAMPVRFLLRRSGAHDARQLFRGPSFGQAIHRPGFPKVLIDPT